jgi:CheY-like chemotaxis protein
MVNRSPKPIRVLHVDDEPDFAELSAVFLENEDDQFEIEIATSPTDGLDMVTDRKPDCIISDYNIGSSHRS